MMDIRRAGERGVAEHGWLSSRHTFSFVPDQHGVPPRYQQVHFPEGEKRGRLRPIITPDGRDGSLSVYQDARAYAGLFDGDEADSPSLTSGRYAYVLLARGEVRVNGQTLGEGDGARLHDEPRVALDGGSNAEVLVFDLRPNEVPQLG